MFMKKTTKIILIALMLSNIITGILLIDCYISYKEYKSSFNILNENYKDLSVKFDKLIEQSDNISTKSFYEEDSGTTYYNDDGKNYKYWINSKTNVRHNRTCRWFGKTEKGYYTNEKKGKACGGCGG